MRARRWVATLAAGAVLAACASSPPPATTSRAAIAGSPGAAAAATAPSSVGTSSRPPTPAGSPSPSGANHSVTTPPLPQRSRFVPTRLRPGERPPQLVVAAFDGAGDVDELRDWRTITGELGSTVSLFLSGVFLLDTAHAWRYHGPGHDRGYSAIGFRTPWEEPIPELTALLSAAWLDGDDIGTHFNGHFCGPAGVDRWTEAQWADELRQWDGLVDGWQADNGTTGAPPLAFDHTVSVGGRTPCLEGRPAAYLAAMKAAGYRYDTSATGDLSWPRRTPQGLWEFPLPTITWKGARGGRVLGMDYNLWYAYNRAGPIRTDAERASVARAVTDTYLAAFSATYDGNRAPLYLSSHMNYWGCNQNYRACNHRANLPGGTPMQHYGPFTVGLQAAYATICRRAEVRCISYRQLADWLDAQDPAVLSALQARPAATSR